MNNYVIDFEAWTTIEAKGEDNAYALAQGIINDLQHLAAKELGIELNMVVADNGIEKEN